MNNITRRKFITSSALASTSLLIPSFLKQLNAGVLIERHGLTMLSENRKLVVVQLSGGNDGLNTVIPFRDDTYYSLRPHISIEKEKVLRINDELGFNPVMDGFKQLYDDASLSIINSVGYPNPDYSHFRSMDIWQTGNVSGQNPDTGWIGRYLDSECQNCTSSCSAVEVDSILSLAMKGKNRTGIAIEDPKRFNVSSSEQFLRDIARENNNMHSDNSDISYLYKTLIDATNSADYIYEKSRIYESKLDYPATPFGRNIKTVAEMIISGLETSVYYVSLPGFDTHINQKGRQERLLKELSGGLNSFAEELKLNGRFDEVLILVFSEFGRRVMQNASAGTDHGSSNNIFLIGGNLKSPGVYNAQPDLKVPEESDLKYEIDFRRVYSSILKRWLDADDELILGGKFEYLNIV